MKKIIACIITLTAALVLTAAAFSSKAILRTNTEFLKNYGWEVSEKPIEKADFTLPQELDAVHENYNELQKEAGLNLIPYLGKSGVRYTYRITNYPTPTEYEVRANLLVIDGKPIAGDICTVNLRGFMHSLIFPE